MSWRQGDIIKEVWGEDNKTHYLLILDVLEPRGLAVNRFRIYDIGEGETSEAGLTSSNQVNYTLHFRPTK